MKTQNKNKKKFEALAQVLILIFGIVAISYAVGSEVGVVGGQSNTPTPTENNEKVGAELLNQLNKLISIFSLPLTIKNLAQQYGLKGDKDGNIDFDETKTAWKEKLAELNKIEDPDQSTSKKINEIENALKSMDSDKIIEKNEFYKPFQNLIDSSKNTKQLKKLVEEYYAETNADNKEEIIKKILKNTGKNEGDKVNEVLDNLKINGGDIDKAVETIPSFDFGKSLKISFTKGKVAGVQFGAYIIETLAVAAGAKVLYMQVYKLMGASARNINDVSDAGWIIAGTAAGTAILAGSGVGFLSAAWGGVTTLLGGTAAAGPPGWVVGAVIIVAMAGYTALFHQDYSREIYAFQAMVWQPKDGGEDCTKCNDLRYGCSEYQCKSYGRACELVNAGTDKEACTWKNKDDITPPLIAPIDEVLKNDYKYEPIKTLSPPDKGVQVYYKPDSKGCVPVFSGLEIGIRTYEEKSGKQEPELAECKIDLERKQTYDEMISYFSEGPVLTEEHKMKIPSSATPSEEAAESINWTVKNGEMNSFYIKCKDANGNPSPMHFVIEFCVQDSPDTKAPTIIGTNYIKEKTFFRYNLTSVPLEVYTDEPADCRWDYQDLEYGKMQNNMTKCSKNANDYLIPSTFDYGCSGTLNGLKDRQENTFYIRCQDKPWLTGQTSIQGKQYSNQESYKLILIGTEPLLINEIKINGKENNTILKDATDNIKIQLEVITYAGADNGKSRCQYYTGGLYYDFFNDGTMEYVQKNTQDLWFLEGVHSIPIRCTDEGGNIAEDVINFEIDVDRETPIVVRNYYDTNNLRIITNEKAECVYTTNKNVGCNYVFPDGETMTNIGGTSHYTPWEPNKKYYIKCKDEYGNQPMPQTQCSVVVSAFEDYGE